jgi:hypothetical protein
LTGRGPRLWPEWNYVSRFGQKKRRAILPASTCHINPLFACGFRRPLRRNTLSLLQVIFQRWNCLRCKVLHVWIFAVFSFVLELTDVLLVIHDHVFHLSTVKRLSGELLKARLGGCIFGVQFLRQSDALLRGNLLQLIRCLRVIGHHALTKLFDLR